MPVGLFVVDNSNLARCAVGLGPILARDAVADPGPIGGENTFDDNADGGDCNSVQDILDAYTPTPLALAAGTLARGTCPATLPPGRSACKVDASARLTADEGRRFTVFLRVRETGRIAFRGEVKPAAGQTASQAIKFTTKRSDPASFTLELVAERGSVPAPSVSAEVVATLAFTKAGGSLRAAEPLTAFPNPATDAATLRFAVAEAGEATLVIYDALGREVARPVDGEVSGLVEAAVDAGALPAGLYVARLVTAGRTETVRLSVVR